MLQPLWLLSRVFPNRAQRSITNTTADWAFWSTEPRVGGVACSKGGEKRRLYLEDTVVLFAKSLPEAPDSPPADGLVSGAGG